MWPSSSPSAPVRAWLRLGLGLASLMLAGCKQQEGERCELASDCANGLECVTVEKQDKQCKPPGGAAPVTPEPGGMGGAGGSPAVDAAAERPAELPREPGAEPAPEPRPEATDGGPGSDVSPDLTGG